MDKRKKYFGARLKMARTEMGLTIKEAAEKVGVSPRTYAKYEQGVMYPLLKNWSSLAMSLMCQ